MLFQSIQETHDLPTQGAMPSKPPHVHMGQAPAMVLLQLLQAWDPLQESDMGRQCPRWGRVRKKRPVTRGPPGAAHRRGGPAHAGSLTDVLTPRSADVRSISSLFTRMRWVSITVIQTPKQTPLAPHQRVTSEKDRRARSEPPSPTRAMRTARAQWHPPGSALEPSDGGGGGCGDPVGGEAPRPCARLCSPRGPAGHSGSGAKSKDSREPETALPGASHEV